MREKLYLGEIYTEGNAVNIRVKHKPLGSQKLVREWFTFADDESLNPEIYGIPRVDQQALPRALQVIKRFKNRYLGSEAENQRLQAVSLKIGSIIESAKQWPEDF